MIIKDDILYVGVNDHKIDLFEGIYTVPNGMAYNSYIITDEKIAVFDSVDKDFGDLWLSNIKSALGGKAPDYLIVQHMEPDHSANIDSFMKCFPDATIVSSAAAFKMINNFFGTEYQNNRIVITEGSTLSLGKHELLFVTAPMVHWPEVFVTYDKTSKTLFSADAFGKFGALDADEDWLCEARRYYFGIVGKYGKPVEALLNKAASLEIETICSLHGPILTENLEYYLNYYKTWSSYLPEEEGVTVAYTSVYGNTKKAAELIYERLKALGVQKLSLCDLARCDMYEAVEDAFRYSSLVLASTTYNAGLFPQMREFITHLTERNYSNRKVGIIENGSWAPTVAKNIKAMFDGSLNITFCDTTVKILSSMNDENLKQLDTLAQELISK